MERRSSGKDEIIYELSVRAFHDSDGNGIGDFPGLLRKIPYLHSLGITTLLLQPFFPSPWRDCGYDISDFTGILPEYGTMHDFKLLIESAHQYGLRTMIELPINHTSDHHSWFLQARTAKKGSNKREFFVWSETTERYNDADNTNWVWDPNAGSYYRYRVNSHEPDLNYENSGVRQAISKVVAHWLEMGVDGLSLVGIPQSCEGKEPGSEDLAETNAFICGLRRYVDERFENRLLLARSNECPENAVSCFGNGDGCHLVGHSLLLPSILVAQHREDRSSLTDILGRTPRLSDQSIWAIPSRCGDLAASLLTEEARTSAFHPFGFDPKVVGNARRIAPLLGNSRRRIELVYSLLLSLPGVPVLYYGDEIGMGDNVYLGKRDGICTPMQWTPDRNAGFSVANPQRLFLPVITDPEYDYKSLNVEVEESNPYSLLCWVKRLISLRRSSNALSCGSFELFDTENRQILAFVRRHGANSVVVVANLSRFAQPVQLNLSEFNGIAPVEMFGGVQFPKIGDLPYFFTLAPHGFYWFRLEKSGLNVAAEISSKAAQDGLAVNRETVEI